jgi:hypothetical protein
MVARESDGMYRNGMQVVESDDAVVVVVVVEIFELSIDQPVTG